MTDKLKDLVEVEPADPETAEYKKKLINKFEDIFIFTKDSVVSEDTKQITVYCRKHGYKITKNRYDFMKRGTGCKKCKGINKGNARKRSKEQFIKEAMIAHGNTYDYTWFMKLAQEKYGTKENVIIKCKHKIFEQSVENHLRGHGCIKCGASSDV